MEICVPSEYLAIEKRFYNKFSRHPESINLGDCLVVITHSAESRNLLPAPAKKRLLFPDSNSLPGNIAGIPWTHVIEFVLENILFHEVIPNELITYEMYYSIMLYLPQSCREWIISGDGSFSNLQYRNLFHIASLIELNHPIGDTVLRLERDLRVRSCISASYSASSKQFKITERIWNKRRAREFETFDDFYSYLDGNLTSADLTEYIFDSGELTQYNLSGAFLSGIAQEQLGLYDPHFYNNNIGQFFPLLSSMPSLPCELKSTQLIPHDEYFDSKLNNRNIHFHYISDIHLNHKLAAQFPTHANEIEVRLFVKKYLLQMLASITRSPHENWILIGGDTSFSFEISKIFYEELRKIWSSNVVVVLGNHELWDISQLSSPHSKTVEEIVSQYRSMLQELDFTLLHNELLFTELISNDYYRYFRSEVLNADELINLSSDLLKTRCQNSQFLIWGGTGFSGYNSSFNATHGLYQNTLTTLEQDLFETQRCEQVYNKLMHTFPHEKVIVLTHMPKENWSLQPYIPSWIYVCGHTHQNHYVQSENFTVYADNQIGYQNKPLQLKFFHLSALVDLFRDYDEGIYHISKQEYLDFNYAIGIRANLNKPFDDIIMLKRCGLYMFLVENTEKQTLSLLNGGNTNKLRNKDIPYYYEHMQYYATNIKLMLQPYHSYLKQIASFIQCIGGSGKIHGSIIDIDFFNHININPHDGSISAYYAPIQDPRIEYPDILQLLQKQCPRLYKNYSTLLASNHSLITIDTAVNAGNAALNEHYSQYKSSNLLKRLQYITEHGVIRIWNNKFAEPGRSSLPSSELL